MGDRDEDDEGVTQTQYDRIINRSAIPSLIVFIVGLCLLAMVGYTEDSPRFSPPASTVTIERLEGG